MRRRGGLDAGAEEATDELLHTRDDDHDDQRKPGNRQLEQLEVGELLHLRTKVVRVSHQAFKTKEYEKAEQCDSQVAPENDAHDNPEQVHEWRLSLKGQARQ